MWPRRNTRPSAVNPAPYRARFIVCRVKPAPGSQLALPTNLKMSRRDRWGGLTS